MQAKCPHCFAQRDCDKCTNGYIEVEFAQGYLYTRKCQSVECGYENGGYIVEQGRPTGPDGEPPSPPGICVLCKEPCLWKFLGAI
jgi:hypothetical protein